MSEQPKRGAKSGLKEGETPNTDATRQPDRPPREEDVFGGHERTGKTKPVRSGATKP